MARPEGIEPIRSEEALLVAGLRNRSDSAFEQLVRAYGGRLLAVAQSYLHDEDDARDALQNTFLAVFKSIHSFSGEAQLSTWLHRIAVNTCLMKLRSRRRRPEQSIEELLPKFADDGHHLHAPVEWKRGDEEVARNERCAIVRRCIDRLPESYRVVLLLRDIEELDTEETAELLGITENAVKIRLHRARQALRTLLDPHFRRGEVG